MRPPPGTRTTVRRTRSGRCRTPRGRCRARRRPAVLPPERRPHADQFHVPGPSVVVRMPPQQLGRNLSTMRSPATRHGRGADGGWITCSACTAPDMGKRCYSGTGRSSPSRDRATTSPSTGCAGAATAACNGRHTTMPPAGRPSSPKSPRTGPKRGATGPKAPSQQPAEAGRAGGQAPHPHRSVARTLPQGLNPETSLSERIRSRSGFFLEPPIEGRRGVRDANVSGRTSDHNRPLLGW
jgi:hypothetical protein